MTKMFHFKKEDFTSVMDEVDAHNAQSLANYLLKQWLEALPTVKYLGYGEWQPENCKAKILVLEDE